MSENKDLKEEKKDLEQDLETTNDMINFYVKKTYETNDDKMKLREMCRSINLKFKDCETVQIPMKEFGNLGNATLQLEDNEVLEIVDKYFNPEFHPFYVDPKTEKEHINSKDEKLLELESKHGIEVKDDVVRALVELCRWNPSGYYPVRIPWNYEKNRELTSSEIIVSIVTQIFNNGGETKCQKCVEEDLS